MMESWARTRELPGRLIAYISPDDPRFSEYQLLAIPEGCEIQSGPRRYITETYNTIIKENPGFDYYSTGNDDHLFVTQGWDRKLVELVETRSNGWGCAMAADGLTDWDRYPHPSGCVVSKKTIDVLGYIFYPKLRHIGTDVTMGRLFNSLGILHGAKDVVIEHRHWLNGARPMDDNYRWVYGQEEQNYGDATATEYMYGQFKEDSEKLRKAIENEKAKEERA